ncbi:hypothetical protein JOD24_001582 [Kroppenstedtia sanguinis]|uniref:DUF3899 domain-containing protein n=1 Tax=Kroppenstedtia sanguinis TaxID=1380684 RepID=A0ABW4C6V0_9BACL
MIRSRIFWTVILAFISVTISYAAGGHLTGMINILFMTGLVLLMLAGGYYVWNGGFFNLVSKGFKILMPNRYRKDFGFEEPLDGSGSEAEQEKRARIYSWIATVAFGVGLIDTSLSFLLIPLI